MVFNYEFENEQELKRIVYEFMNDLNNERSQAVNNHPSKLLIDE